MLSGPGACPSTLKALATAPSLAALSTAERQNNDQWEIFRPEEKCAIRLFSWWGNAVLCESSDRRITQAETNSPRFCASAASTVQTRKSRSWKRTCNCQGRGRMAKEDVESNDVSSTGNTPPLLNFLAITVNRSSGCLIFRTIQEAFC